MMANFDDCESAKPKSNPAPKEPKGVQLPKIIVARPINPRPAGFQDRSWMGGLEHSGLVLANGIATGIESLIGPTILNIRWKGINTHLIRVDVGRALVTRCDGRRESALRPPSQTGTVGAVSGEDCWAVPLTS